MKTSWPFVLTTSGFAELESRAPRRARRDVSATDFSGLEHTASEREAMQVWRDNQMADLEDKWQPCSDKEDAILTGGVALFATLACVLVGYNMPLIIRWIKWVFA